MSELNRMLDWLKIWDDENLKDSVWFRYMLKQVESYNEIFQTDFNPKEWVYRYIEELPDD